MFLDMFQIVAERATPQLDRAKEDVNLIRGRYLYMTNQNTGMRMAQHSQRLVSSLSQAAKNLQARPVELRGPFSQAAASKTTGSPVAADSAIKKK
jgi:hypothetical protein